LLLSLAACGRSPSGVSTALGAAEQEAPDLTVHGSVSGLLTGDELLAEPFVLPDELERVIPTDSGIEGVAFLQQRWEGDTCIGFRYPDIHNAWVDVCKAPSSWDSFTTIYSTSPDGERHFVLGAVVPDVDEVQLTFDGEVVTIPTAASEHTDLVRFFAAEVPDVWQTVVEGLDEGVVILRIEYPPRSVLDSEQ
jgi:hypothetical protein